MSDSAGREQDRGEQVRDVHSLQVRVPQKVRRSKRSASSNAADHRGLLPDLLRSVTRSVVRRPLDVAWLVTLLVCLSVGVSFRFLSFKTDRADLINPRAEFQQRWLQYTERFGDDSDVVVVVEGPNEGVIKAVLDDLGRQLEAEPHLFDRVFYKFDPAGLMRKSLQYLPPADLETCLHNLDRYSEILNGRWDLAGLQVTTERLHEQLQSDQPQQRAEAIAHARQLAASLQTFVSTGEFESPWPLCLPASAQSQTNHFRPTYQMMPSGKMGLLLAIPVKGGDDFEGSSPSLDRLREIIADTKELYDGVEIGLTGIPVLESDEMRRSQSDMSLASAVSFIGVGFTLLFGFRGIRHPLIAMLMLLIGMAWSLGYATLFVGHLNILSVSFAAILIGLGIDPSIHYISRYLELRHAGVHLRSALMQTARAVGPGIVTAAVTTALAFFCAAFTSFLGVAELGIIAGGGVLLCCVATFIVLPVLIAIADRRSESRGLPIPFQGVLLRRVISRRPRLVSLLAVALIVGTGFGCITFEDGRIVSRITYDANLLNLQAEGIESVEVQNRVFRESQGSLLYAVSQANGPGELLERRAAMEALPTVSRVEELASMMPRHDPAHIRLLVHAISSQLSRLSEFPREFPRLNPQAIGLALEDLYLRLKELDEPIAKEAVLPLNAFLDRLEAIPLEQQIGILDGYQYAMLSALKGQFAALAAVADPTPVSPQDFPRAVRERFVSEDGTWLMRIYPKNQVWDEEPLAEFVGDVRSVDPNATGTPLQNYEASREIRDCYLQAAVYALIVVWIVLLIDTVETRPLMIGLMAPLVVMGFAVIAVPGRQSLELVEMLALYVALVTAATAIFDFANLRYAALAIFTPMAGMTLMFGILGWCDINLNPANMIVLPLIMGIGVDNGVFVIHDFRSQSGAYRTSASTVNAMMLNSLTTMMGFGSMMISAHRGLASLGLVLVIGVGCCLFVSLVTLPAILTVISLRRSKDSSSTTPPEESLSENRQLIVLPSPQARAA